MRRILRGQELGVRSIEADPIEVREVRVAPALASNRKKKQVACLLVDAQQLEVGGGEARGERRLGVPRLVARVAEGEAPRRDVPPRVLVGVDALQLDAADLERSIPAMRARIADTGIAPDGLQVVTNLRVVTAADDTIDVDRTLEPVAAGVAAGATDFLTRFRAPTTDRDFEAALTELVAAFRSRTGRPA